MNFVNQTTSLVALHAAIYSATLALFHDTTPMLKVNINLVMELLSFASTENSNHYNLEASALLLHRPEINL